MFKYALTILILFFSSYVYSNENELTVSQQLERLQREVSDLSKEVFLNSSNQSNETNNDFVKNLSAIDLRIYDIENDIKNLTSNLEELYFQLDDIFNKLENLELVINNFQSVPLNNVEVNTDEASQDSFEVKSNTLSDTETENTLGTLNISKNTNDTNEEVVSENQEVNLNNKEEALSPEDQFQVAFDNIRDKKWQDAKTSFKQFISDNPDNQLSGSAHYWLGELYILEKNYREAALIFAEGFQKFPDSIKAAEMLFKLSQSLYQVEKNTEACKTMEKLIIDFPKNKIIPQTKKQIVEYNCLENNE
ncbi:tol-pal system protein YbgF [Pelagibacteraceae bacterium]|nr:tol-pal system protein YbgF [Pelagibacteraceae bacterium]